MTTPTLIDMPEPPSNPDTPTEAPGTPNSTTTSLSALSTTAIKDGHRGTSFPYTGHGHHHTPSSTTLEAERADRISRLAGLERVSTVRPPNPNALGGGGAGPVGAGGQIPGYFDANGNPVYTTKMSTVGSASATGSIGGRTTTWASGSAKGTEDDGGDGERETDGDVDQMSMDTNYRDDDRDRFSASAMDEDDGMSDDTSLVGFGEGAGSTVSGPTYSRRDLVSREGSGVGRSGLGAGVGVGGPGPGPVTSSGERTTSTAEQQRREAKVNEGLAADEPASGYVDTAARGGAGVPPTRTGGSGVETAERISRNRLDDGEGRNKPLGSPDEADLGKFYFEEK